MSNEDGAGRLPNPPPPDLSPFERFEQLTRQLVSVPKSAIDERRREGRKGRAGPVESD